MLIVTILAGIGFAGSVLALLLWSTVLHRIIRVRRNRPTVRAGLALPAPEGGWPPVTIIVPAHNEERIIGDCATTIRAQTYPDLEVVFVLDRCTDRTLEILRPHAEADPRVRIIENDACPPDWLGKCNALRVGTEQAKGHYLLFVDADTMLAPDLVRAAVAIAERGGLALVSLLSDLTPHRLHERLAQPVAAMSLVQLYPIERVNRVENPRPFANGQFMLFRRDVYEAMGGHARVKDCTMEDIQIARCVHEHGGRGAIYLADGMFTCSMYESWHDFCVGWQRIFAGACNFKPSRLRKNARRVLATGIAFPILQALSLVAAVLLARSGGLTASVVALAAVPVLGWLVQLVALAGAYRMGNMSVGTIFFYPIGCWTVARIMRRAASDLARRRPIAWAGREYSVEPR